MQQAGAPSDLVEEVSDVDVEGGGVAQALMNGWETIEYELDIAREPGFYPHQRPGTRHDH